MLTRRLLVTGGCAFALATTALGQGLPRGRPEQQGLSEARLERLGTTLREYANGGRIAGTVALIARNGTVVYLDSSGYADKERGAVMRPDAIFRIASMSKAITSVAIMMLVEEGRIGLNDPVSKFIPGFARTAVAKDSTDALGKKLLVRMPAKRQITIRDLLTHTAGISYGGEPLLDSLYRAANVYMWYFADKAEPICTTIERLPSLPFTAQPGEAFVYGFNTDILGCVVERASGMSLDQFVQSRITGPLRMTDTHFYLPPEKTSRLAAVYSARDGRLERAPDQAGMVSQGDYVTGPRMSYSGGAGILSTALDYARFLQMLANGGQLDGVRLLSPKTVELMTVNHAARLYGQNEGFGLGFSIMESPGSSAGYGSPGLYSWGGAYYTAFWVDPKEKLVAVFMSQLLPANGLDLQAKFRTLVYQAMTESYEK